MDKATVEGYLNYDKNNKWHRRIRTVIVSIVSLVVFVLLWWNIALLFQTSAIPTPDRVWDSFLYLFENGDSVTGMSMWDHIWISFERFLAGFLIAFAVGVPFGLLLGYSETFREFSSPTLEVLRPIAPIAWAPVFMFTIGYTWGPIMVVFVGIVFPLITNTMFGVKKIEPVLVDAARTLGATKAQIFYKVTAPSAFPYVMNGVRIGSGVGWMCIVASELYASYGGGIGYFVGVQSSIGFWPNVFVGIIIIAILGLLTTGLFDYIYKVVVKRMGLE